MSREQANEQANDAFDNWTVQLRKGLLELWVLRALGRGERYGYDMVREMVERSGLGVTEGTLYPLLSRMRMLDWVSTRLEESSGGPARKYYRLTPAGRATLSKMNPYLQQLLDGMENPS